MPPTNEERKSPSNLEFPAMNEMAPDEPAGSRTKSALLEYVENNPVAALLQALAIGFAVGMIVRLLERGEKQEEVEVSHKPTLDEAKFHLGSLVLPFLWPAWRKAREGYGKSTEALQEAVDKIKKGDLTSEGRKHLRKFEQWAEREAGHLADFGKGKAKSVEKWVEDEVLPAAECGWKRLRKLIGME